MNDYLAVMISDDQDWSWLKEWLVKVENNINI